MIESIPLTQLTEKYFFADLAAGKPAGQQLKRVRARQAIVGVAPYYLRTRRLLFVVYAWAGRIPTQEFKKKILQVAEEWRPTKFGIEANAMQSLFADTVIHEAKVQKLKVALVPIDQPTKIDKLWRIRTTLQPEVAFNNLFLQHSQTELQTELVGFPIGATMDIVDARASIVYHLLPKKATPQQVNEEKDALAEYMRLAGKSPWEISRRLGQ
jgi:hypothetical protein